MPPMKTKLDALKQADPDGMRVVSPRFRRMIRPASLPARASPPGELNQISEMPGWAASAASSRSGSPASTRPSASKILTPFRSTGVSTIVGLVDQLGWSGHVGFKGSIAEIGSESGRERVGQYV